MVQSVRKTTVIPHAFSFSLLTVAPWKRSVAGIFFAMPSQRRVLVVGGSFAELCVVCAMKYNFLVTFVDAQDNLDALTFMCSLGKLDDVPVMQVVQVSQGQVVRLSCSHICSSLSKSLRSQRHSSCGNREGVSVCAFRPTSLLCRSCRFVRCRL